MSESVLLHVHTLRKTFQTQPLLAIENWHIAAASAYVLTGKNGVGKSVLLRILAGFEHADEVDCRWLGQPQALHPYPNQLRREMIYVHQHPIMLRMSVRQNIAYGLRAQGRSTIETKQAVDEAMEWAGVQHLSERMPQGLSGGEKQRIALARAQVLRPKLLLLDEPTANLDGQAREQVIALIPSLIAAGQSVVMACHDRDLLHLPQVQHIKLRDGKIETKPT
jgi:tungstate transport system ATP-binding protein